MNRRMITLGALGQDLDVNQNMQFAMVSDGFLAEATMGQSSWAYGLAMSATSPASMSLIVGRGEIGAMTVVDETNPGTSAIADTSDALMKVGINLAGTTIAFTAPTTSGQSQVFLIEGQPQESDTGATVLPFYNPTPPYTPFSGPANSGAATNTIRQNVVAIQVVAGAPAATGSQVAPTATTGWVPLWLVTLANGATTITSANFVQHPSAPFLPFSLPNLTPGFSHSVPLTGSGNFTFPLWVKNFRVRATGSGGGGASSSSAIYPGGGGGGAGHAEGIYTNTPGTAYAYLVAQAVAGATAGQTTSFGSFISATGGGAGVAGTSGGVGAGGAGGTGIGGNTRNVTGSGGTTGINFTGGSGFLEGGMGGSAASGPGPARATGGSSGGFAANNGAFPGGGSTGCVGATATSGAGELILEY